MINKSLVHILLAGAIYYCSCTSGKKILLAPDVALLQTIEQNFRKGAAQYRLMMKNLGPEEFPKNYDPKKGRFETSNSAWWCSGFYPGTLLYLYEQTNDQALYDEAIRIMKVLEKEKKNTGTHDLGFMMFCSFGNAERIAPMREYKEVLLQSARSLSTRFSPVVGCIKSWDSKPADF